ncbi:MAG: methyltransferase domain-containing protein [Planctomycetota bacterium]
MPRRRLTPELMDDPAVDREQLDGALRFIRGINKRLGGVSALVKHLDRWSPRWPTDRPITLLDNGTGSADLPLEAVRWARSRGFDLRVTGIDVHETTLELARDHIEADRDCAGSITLRQADALKLDETFEPGSFDYVHAGLFLHHLTDTQIMIALRLMDRLAARGIIWNDLVRSTVGRGFIHIATIGRPEIIRHDARVSVEAGFTKAEVLDYARRLDLGHCRYEWNLFTHRFTLAGECPHAW